jgi:hypothetical protein
MYSSLHFCLKKNLNKHLFRILNINLNTKDQGVKVVAKKTHFKIFMHVSKIFQIRPILMIQFAEAEILHELKFKMIGIF